MPLYDAHLVGLYEFGGFSKNSAEMRLGNARGVYFACTEDTRWVRFPQVPPVL